MSNEVSQDIRGVLIAVTGARVLLPNATVAEVITYSPPDPIEGAPAWMLGRIRWRGWRLPVISYARMIASAENEGEFGAKVVVLKALGGNPDVRIGSACGTSTSATCVSGTMAAA